MFAPYTCHLQGKEHEWILETVSFGPEDDYYKSGLMEQRRCPNCGNVEYIRFHGEHGVTDIETPLLEAGLRPTKLGG